MTDRPDRQDGDGLLPDEMEHVLGFVSDASVAIHGKPMVVWVDSAREWWGGLPQSFIKLSDHNWTVDRWEPLPTRDGAEGAGEEEIARVILDMGCAPSPAAAAILRRFKVLHLGAAPPKPAPEPPCPGCEGQGYMHYGACQQQPAPDAIAQQGSLGRRCVHGKLFTESCEGCGYVHPRDRSTPVPLADGAPIINHVRALGPPDPSDEEFEHGWAACNQAVVDLLTDLGFSPSPAVAAEPTDAKPNYEAAAIALGYRRTPSGVWWHPNQHPNFTERFKAAEAIFDRYFGAHWLSEAVAAEPARPCTCHPGDNPPVPCAKRYALSECMAWDAALWALVSTLHSNIDEEKRPKGWCDFSDGQIDRLNKAANAFLLATPPVRGDREAIAQFTRIYVDSALRWRPLVDGGRGGNNLNQQQTSELICERLTDAILSFVQPGAGERGSDAAEADRYFDMAGEFGNRIQRAVTLIEDYDRHGSVDHSIAFEVKKILDPESALSRQAPHSSSEGGR